MSVHINEVLSYLDAHPIHSVEVGVESLLEMLHEVYTMYNSIDSEERRALFEKLRPIMESLPSGDRDALFSAVCDLCREHEQLAFSQGIVAGMQLMTEVNRLP